MLDTGFLISCIVNLFIGLIFFLFFLYVSLRIDKIPIIRNIINTKIGYYFVYFVFGFIVGLISLFLNLIKISLNNYYIVVGDIPLIVLSIFYITPFAFIGSTISYFSFSILFNYQNQNNLLLVIYSFIFYLFLCLIVTFLHIINKKKFLYFILISIPIIAFSLIFAVTFIPNEIINLAYVLPWINLIYLLIYYLFSIPLINYIGKTKQLSQAIQFDKNDFVLSSYTNDFLWKKITNNKIQYGIMILFSIASYKEKNKKINELIAKMIKSKINLLLKNDKPNWFLSPSNYYGVFIPLSKEESKRINLNQIYSGNNLKRRSTNDLFYSYELMFKSVPKKIKYKNDEYSIEIKTAGIIYGIHSTDFNKMISLSEILIKQYDLLKKSNIVQVFDPVEFKLFESDANIYKNLSQKIPLNEINSYWDEFISLKESNIKFYSSNFCWLSKLLLNKNNILASLQDSNINDALIRFFAMKSINAFTNENLHKNKKNYLIIDYSLNLFKNDEFNSKSFLSKINQHNLITNNLIINIF
ncbi:hypothetical protein, partial [Mycoplasmoides pirum]